jgi:putative tryptophan/tyrosine transport system substrate-binding protein
MSRVFAVIALAVFLAAPLPAGTEPKGKIYRIGYLTLWYSTSDPAQRLALAEGLRIRGYREGDGIVFESRYAEGKIERLPELAGELVRRGVDVIVAVSTPAGLAARQATSTIPIVVAGSGDMVDSGLVTNVNRPGGNVTGVQFLRRELAVRQIEILRQIVPHATRFAYLGNPDVPSDVSFFRALEGRAQSSGATVRFVPAKVEYDYKLAFPAMIEGGVEALIVGAGVTQFDVSKNVVRLVSQNRLPAMYPGRQFVEAGGLVSYFANPSDQGRHVAVYVDKILKGAKAGDLPVEQYSSYELAINLRVAKALFLTVPSALLKEAADVFR